ncbi:MULTISPECIES: hypothetical protein, partial [unclassified Microcoleus]|uniref:hypothetical protein n=1 Tax=unclassified Microcoleus TaxID=2642155 RepID=UPI002FD6333E
HLFSHRMVLDFTFFISITSLKKWYKLICVVHDEILIESPIEEVKPVKAMLKKCMVRAGNKFLSPIPCEVEIKVMESWGG